MTAIPGLDAHASVTFNDSMGATFAQILVTLADGEQVKKTIMSATRLDLGQGRSLVIQSIDWQLREVWVLPIIGD